MDHDIFLCASPLSPPAYPVCADAISPLVFPPPDDLFPGTPPAPPGPSGVSPVVRAPNLWIASPLTPLTDTPPRIKRKYIAANAPVAHAAIPAPDAPTDAPQHPQKKRRTLRSRLAISTTASSSSSSSSSSASSQPSSSPTTPVYTTRALPPSVSPHPAFPLLYRRFPLSSYYAPTPDADPTTLFNPSHPGGSYNPPRSPIDLYTPRFTRGKGPAKQGLCPVCVEPRARGGESTRVWLAMKFSAFNYHLQYYHGISAPTGRPFAPPLAFRVTPRPGAARNERTEMKEAMCHRCEKWIAVEGVKDVEAKVWKHAALCHGASELDNDPGDPDGVYEHDAVYA
ncbi:hypothetical protein H0H87_006393, partial [Tephrocybe sp. NHM501043]